MKNIGQTFIKLFEKAWFHMVIKSELVYSFIRKNPAAINICMLLKGNNTF
jgi:hypothetical protein